MALAVVRLKLPWASVNPVAMFAPSSDVKTTVAPSTGLPSRVTTPFTSEALGPHPDRARAAARAGTASRYRIRFTGGSFVVGEKSEGRTGPALAIERVRDRLGPAPAGRADVTAR